MMSQPINGQRVPAEILVPVCPQPGNEATLQVPGQKLKAGILEQVVKDEAEKDTRRGRSSSGIPIQ